MTDHLDLWLYDAPLARVERLGTHRAALRWHPDAEARWGAGSTVLSHLLPLGADPHPARATAWLDGLLPEGAARSHLAVEAGIADDDVVGFLDAYGAETAGAAVFVRPGGPVTAQRPDPAPLTDHQVGRLLREAASRTGRRLGATSSLPGMEPKITLARDDAGRWVRSGPERPSTHILKLERPADSDVADLVDTEAAALDLARRVGLTTVDAQVRSFDGVRAVVVSRYDRPTVDGVVTRLHQEDVAQMLGLNTADPNRKFQRGKTLPSLAAAARALRDDGAGVAPLLALTTFNLAIGNTDAHAKNISALRHPDGRVELAPAYDVSMHLHHPQVAGIFAMDVAGKNRMREIDGTDLVAEGASWGLTSRAARRTVEQTLGALLAALGAVDRDAHPGVSAPAWDTVAARTESLLRSSSAGQASSAAGRGDR